MPDKPLEFNEKCPLCDGPIHIVHGSFRNVDIPIRKNGWAVMVTHRHTNGSEGMMCPKCNVTVPAMWIYKQDPDSITKLQAQALMKSWMPKESKPKKRIRAEPEEEKETA